jgi:hypothetical protein
VALLAGAIVFPRVARLAFVAALGYAAAKLREEGGRIGIRALLDRV